MKRRRRQAVQKRKGKTRETKTPKEEGKEEPNESETRKKKEMANWR